MEEVPVSSNHMFKEQEKFRQQESNQSGIGYQSVDAAGFGDKINNRPTTDNDQRQRQHINGSSKKRSKNGCMTCKIRKKRCDEVKPVCGDCVRLKRECSWVSPEMSSEEVRALKKQVELIEEDSKSRKRRKKVPETAVTENRVVRSASPAAAASPFALSPFLTNLENYLFDYQNEINDNHNNNNSSSNKIEDLDLNTNQPVLYYTPSANHDLLNELTPLGLKLYDYFRNKLARVISIVPAEENLFLKTFLPMAHQDLGVLYGIIAWSGIHSNMRKEGEYYLEKSAALLKTQPLNPGNDELINMRIANYLILCGTEICRGDVRNWSKLLEECSKLIKLKGIRAFDDSKTRHWLVSNFAYHDIMTSSILERGIYFSLEDYNHIINLKQFGLDPLHGLSKPLFQLLGEISNYAMNFNKMLALTVETLSDNSYKNRYNLLQQIRSTAKQIDQEIDDAKPNLKDLYKLSSDDIELQLTLFESYQITAKLHLRQSIMKLNPKNLEVQFLCVELLRCLDIVLGSNVESSLVFPLFMLGINLGDEKDRELILVKFDEFHKRYNYGNISRARKVMQFVWEKNCNGEKCIDWCGIVKDLGWELSFA